MCNQELHGTLRSLHRKSQLTHAGLGNYEIAVVAPVSSVVLHRPAVERSKSLWLKLGR